MTAKFVTLTAHEDGEIVGLSDGRIAFLPRDQLIVAESAGPYVGPMRVDYVNTNVHRVKREVIRLNHYDLEGHSIVCGYGPRSKVWAVYTSTPAE
jgi:hypothetical protein